MKRSHLARLLVAVLGLALTPIAPPALAASRHAGRDRHVLAKHRPHHRKAKRHVRHRRAPKGRAAAGTNVLSDGFESGSLTGWTVVGHSGIRTWAQHTGRYGLLIAGDPGKDFVSRPVSGGELTLETDYQRLGGGWQPLVRLSANDFTVADDGNGALFAITGPTWRRIGTFWGSMRTWTRLRVDASPSQGTITVLVDGVKQATFARAVVPETQVNIGDTVGLRTGGFLFDNVRITTVPSPAPKPAAPSAPPPATPLPAPATPPAPAPAAAPGLPGRLFSSSSIWNAPLTADAALSPDSDSLVAELMRQLAPEIAGVWGPWINTTSYSTPIYTVGADQPAVHVTLDTNNPTLQRDFDQVPVPAGAEQAWGSDAQMVVFQPTTDTMWEFWHMNLQADGWHARWGGKMVHVPTNPGYFSAPWGASATSLPLIAGTMTIGELQAGHIDHALALAIPDAAAGRFTFPAQRTDGGSTSAQAIPEGTRFRLDPKLDLSTLRLSPIVRMMAVAAQRYGIVVRDKSGCVTFFAEDPRPRTANPYPSLFGGQNPSQFMGQFPWSHLQVVSPPTS